MSSEKEILDSDRASEKIFPAAKQQKKVPQSERSMMSV